jgi:hypothetical protein
MMRPEPFHREAIFWAVAYTSLVSWVAAVLVWTLGYAPTVSFQNELVGGRCPFGPSNASLVVSSEASDLFCYVAPLTFGSASASEPCALAGGADAGGGVSSLAYLLCDTSLSGANSSLAAFAQGEPTIPCYLHRGYCVVYAHSRAGDQVSMLGIGIALTVLPFALFLLFFVCRWAVACHHSRRASRPPRPLAE